MLGPDAASVLAAAVAPVRIIGLRPRQVVAKLGASLVVAFDGVLEHPDGRVDRRVLVARSGGRLPEGAALVSDGTNQVAIWMYPDDPELPGLRALHDPVRAAELMARVGVSYPVEMAARSYRPGRRAVIELGANGIRLFAKAVRPRVVADLQARHRLLAPLVRTPRSLGWSDKAGLVLMEPVAGQTLLAMLSLLTPIYPEGEAVLDVLDRLPKFSAQVMSPVDRVGEQAGLLGLLAPKLVGLIQKVAAAIRTVPPDSMVPVHGDLHAGQLVFDREGSGGLIDIDSVGVGSRTDDLAGLLAHLAAVGGNDRYIESLMTVFARRVDRAPLRLRTAAALLGFASVPFVNQEPDWPDQVATRIATAARWASR